MLGLTRHTGFHLHRRGLQVQREAYENERDGHQHTLLKLDQMAGMQKAIHHCSEETAEKIRKSETLSVENEQLQEELARSEMRLAETISDNRDLRQVYRDLKMSVATSAEAKDQELAEKDEKIEELENTVREQEEKYATAIRLLDEVQKIVRREQEEKQLISFDTKNSTRAAKVFKKTNKVLVLERDRLTKEVTSAKLKVNHMKNAVQKLRKLAVEKNSELVRQNQAFRERVKSLETSVYGRSITVPLHKSVREMVLSLSPPSVRKEYSSSITASAAVMAPNGSLSARKHTKKTKKSSTTSRKKITQTKKKIVVLTPRPRPLLHTALKD